MMGLGWPCCLAHNCTVPDMSAPLRCGQVRTLTVAGVAGPVGAVALSWYLITSWNRHLRLALAVEPLCQRSTLPSRAVGRVGHLCSAGRGQWDRVALHPRSCRLPYNARSVVMW